MDEGKTHLENGKVVMSQKEIVESWVAMFAKDKTLQQLRECAESIKAANPTVTIPDNCCRLDPGNYTGEELGAVVYFIADMLE